VAAEGVVITTVQYPTGWVFMHTARHDALTTVTVTVSLATHHRGNSRSAPTVTAHQRPTPAREFHDSYDPGGPDMLGLILFLLIIGIVAGFLARAIVPGSDPLGIGGTILLGVVGSFIGGFLGYLLFREDGAEGALQPSGIIGSVIGAIIALLVYRAANGRSVSRNH
jgi:uncharacterized membrane protein YeaQ/YmgE (transglycosylase-associated protein family)